MTSHWRARNQADLHIDTILRRDDAGSHLSFLVVFGHKELHGEPRDHPMAWEQGRARPPPAP